MDAEVFKANTRPRDQVLDGPRHERISGTGKIGNARGDVDGDPAYIAVAEFDFARV